MAEQSSGDTIKGLIFLAALAYGGYWYYTTYQQPEEMPPIITKTTPGVYGGEYAADIVSVSRGNDVRFKNVYKGHPFISYGKFKEANEDMGRHHIAVTTVYGDIACQTRYQSTVDHVGDLIVGQAVTISGIIDDTWMGDVLLIHCRVD